MNILQINSSARAEGSHSTRLGIGHRRPPASLPNPDATLTRARPRAHAAPGARRSARSARCSRRPTSARPSRPRGSRSTTR